MPFNYRLAKLDREIFPDDISLSGIKFTTPECFADPADEQIMSEFEGAKQNADVIYEVDFLSTMENAKLLSKGLSD
jgi:hypothetical protein